MKNLNQLVVTEISHVYTVFSQKGRLQEIKKRFSYALIFCFHGEIVYYHNGQEYHSNHDCAILLPKGQSYTLHGTQEGLFPLINFQCTDSFSTEEFLVFPLNNPDSYLKDYERMRHMILSPQNHAQMMSLFYQIISRLASEKKGKYDLLTPALTYLEQHFSDPSLNVKKLSEKAFISEAYFRRLFLKRFGVTPGQYLSDVRIRNAKQLLAGTNNTVSSIGEECGFSSVYHFSRAFKSFTGQTPLEFRKNAANPNIY